MSIIVIQLQPIVILTQLFTEVSHKFCTIYSCMCFLQVQLQHIYWPCSYSCTYISTYLHSCMHTCTACSYTYAHTHSFTHSLTHMRMYSHTVSHTCIFMHTHMHIYAHTHAQTHMHSQRHEKVLGMRAEKVLCKLLAIWLRMNNFELHIH